MTERVASLIPGLMHPPYGISKRTLSARDFEYDPTEEESERTRLLFELAHLITPEQAHELRLMHLDHEMLGMHAYEHREDGLFKRIDPSEFMFQRGQWLLHTPNGPEIVRDVGPRFISVAAVALFHAYPVVTHLELSPTCAPVNN
jgi:hypothetical protein